MSRFSSLSIFAILSFVLISNHIVESAQILAIFPFAGPSQYMSVQPYLKALAGRGHNVTAISGFPQKEPVENYHDLPVEEVLTTYDEFVMLLVVEKDLTHWKRMDLFDQYHRNLSTAVLDNENVHRHLFDPKTRYDLIIIESIHMELLYALSQRFGASLIGVSTYGTDPHVDELVNNVSPMSYTPLFFSDMTDRMDFWQRLKSVWLTAEELIHRRWIYTPQQEILYKKYFPNATASLHEIRNNFSLILVNQHFSLSFARPYVPNMIEVGGMHLNYTRSPLPTDMEEFLNASPNGVVYFSLGAQVKSKNLPKDRLEMLMRAFAALPQRVMWKFEEPNLPGKPKNVYIAKWFPQSDILAHPKVKLFLTHCGLLGTMEAIYHGKPVVGMPVFFDQFLNMARVKEAGYGLGVTLDTVTSHELILVIQEVITNGSFAEMARRLSARYRDQPMTPLETAIFWTEYILRHNGAPHMRVSARYLNFSQQNSVDTVGFIILCLLLIVSLPFIIIWMLLKYWRHRQSADPKRKLY